MDSFNLRVFIEVVDQGSLSAVARAFSMRVSGISMLISRLEAHYGVELIAREGRAVVPTTAGEILYEHAKETIEAEHRLEQEMDFAREIDRGWVRIGAIRRIADGFLPPILARFRESHPDVSVRVEVGTSDLLRNLLLTRRVEFACTVAQEDEALTNTPLYRERLLIVAEPHDLLAERQTVSVQEILRRPFVMAGRRSGLHRRALLEKALGRSGLIVTREVADQEALKEAVRQGLGCGLLPQTLVESDLRNGLLAEISVDGVSLVEEICLVRRSRGHLSPGAMAFGAEILDSQR
jgi:DNA-binding transcriptional LysR family regulator